MRDNQRKRLADVRVDLVHRQEWRRDHAYAHFREARPQPESAKPAVGSVASRADGATGTLPAKSLQVSGEGMLLPVCVSQNFAGFGGLAYALVFGMAVLTLLAPECSAHPRVQSLGYTPSVLFELLGGGWLLWSAKRSTALRSR